MIVRRRSVLSGALAAAFPAVRARAQGRPTIRVGVLTSLSGPYQDGAGAGSVLAARMAAEDFARDHDPGFSVEILAGDMQDKPDVGAEVARAWFDRDAVDAVCDVPNSAVALAVATVARERDKVALFSGPGVASLSGSACGPNHVQWTYDTGALAATTGRAVLAEGGRRWFFIAADYAFGHALRADTARVVEAGGGTVLGGIAFPFPDTTDFSSYLLAARASGADVIGLACTASHFVTLVKQAHEFGITKGGQRLASLICLVTNIRAIGLPDAQGLRLSLPFYWDLNDGTRDFSRRFGAAFGGAMPSMVQAGAYSATLHYLKAVAALGPARARDGAAAVAGMKRIPVRDPLFGRSILRANGSVAHDMHLFRVKAPAESRGGWDYLAALRTIPAAEAFRPVDQSGCRMERS